MNFSVEFFNKVKSKDFKMLCERKSLFNKRKRFNRLFLNTESEKINKTIELIKVRPFTE